MAKRRSGHRSRRRGFQAIQFETTLTLSTLTDNTVISASMLGAELSEDYFWIGLDASWSLFGGTVGEGPIQVGVAHNDLSVTEIAEALTVEITDPSDIIARERSRRPVRKVGAFPGLATNETINDGDQIRTRTKFMLGDGHGPAVYAVNRSNATLTGGQVVEVEGTLFGRWVR